MNFIKNMDAKTMLIWILGIVLCVTLYFNGQKINKHKEELKTLQEQNTTLEGKNDSLKNNIEKLDVILTDIDKKLNQNNKEMEGVNQSIEKLKNRKNEIPTYVNSLSANSTADALSNYLDRKTKSKSTSK
jgi:peptidoglycan hydrolase CwlO-like protein